MEKDVENVKNFIRVYIDASPVTCEAFMLVVYDVGSKCEAIDVCVEVLIRNL
jgi:hypothetical protein